MSIDQVTQYLTFAAAALAVYKGFRNASRLEQVHVDLNSRLTEFLALARKSGMAEGRKKQLDDPSSEV